MPASPAWAAVEQLARDWTWTPQTVDASEVLFQAPSAASKAKQNHPGAWPGADQIPLDVFRRPAGLDQIFVLSGCADDVAGSPRPFGSSGERDGGRRPRGAKAAEVARAMPLPATSAWRAKR